MTILQHTDPANSRKVCRVNPQKSCDKPDHTVFECVGFRANEILSDKEQRLQLPSSIGQHIFRDQEESLTLEERVTLADIREFRLLMDTCMVSALVFPEIAANEVAQGRCRYEIF